MRFILVVAMLASMSCATGRDRIPSDCNRTRVNGIVVDWCAPDRTVEERWVSQIPSLLRVYDDELAKAGLAPLTPAMEGARVEVREPLREGWAGEYLICGAPFPAVRVALPWEVSPIWRVALVHELWHLYEDRVLDVPCADSLRAMSTPAHFVEGETYKPIHTAVRSRMKELSP